MRALRLAGVVGAAAAAVLAVTAATPAAAGEPAAETVTSIPTVGPLFLPSLAGLGPALRLPHYCSAGVVHSRHHDLVLTAAHCVYGAGFGIGFAPGYHDGVSPHGVWTVRRVYLDPAWRHGHDPQRDVAVLEMSRRNGAGVEDATGPAPSLGTAPPAGTQVTVDGYVAGSGGEPITCTAPAYYAAGFPSFDCAGYAGGVSGGPWLAGGQLVGVTGGLHQGGCTPSTSYTSAFGADVAALLARAEAGGPGDLAPLPGSDGC
jgi:hypothetical protein